MSSMKDQLYGNSTCTKSSVKRNTCTEDNTQRVGTSNQWPVQTCMYNSSLINGIECMCMSQCL